MSCLPAAAWQKLRPDVQANSLAGPGPGRNVIVLFCFFYPTVHGSNASMTPRAKVFPVQAPAVQNLAKVETKPFRKQFDL